ncbi:hypothetical protein [Hyphomonas sp.]|uniref:hypothetical protein n=1 Tax=Hyphomonas sp. TaxID=87 RepID=UPI003919D671
MSEAQAKSDPALDLSRICQRLLVGTNKSGATFIAEQFGVQVWSNEFMEALVQLRDRVTSFQALSQKFELDPEPRKDLDAALNSIGRAFEFAALTSPWNNTGGGVTLLAAEHWKVVRMTSGAAKTHSHYPLLSQSEADEIIKEIDELLSWLTDHQLEEYDLIRHAIIEGLKKFRFQLKHIEWLGWENAMGSLREVAHAYIALHRGEIDPIDMPSYAATNQKVSSFLHGQFAKLLKVKESVEGIVWIYAGIKVIADMTSNNPLPLLGFSSS